jgi:DNA-binding MarR family transcriptional regulator
VQTTQNMNALRIMRSFWQLKRSDWYRRAADGLKPSEMHVLVCIKRHEQCSPTEMKVSEISKCLQVTSPTVTQLLKGLEASGLIERHIDPSDRRAVGIRLTAKGDELARKAREAFLASFYGLTEYLGEEESQQLADLLEKVITYFHQENEQWQSFHWMRDEET